MNRDEISQMTGEEIAEEVRRQNLFTFTEQVLVASGLPVLMALVCAPFVLLGWLNVMAVLLFLVTGAATLIAGMIPVTLLWYQIRG
jgi:hypothetical protein